MKQMVDLESLPVTHVWEGVEARTIGGDGVTVAIIELAPGTSVPLHQHPNEQVGILVRGRMRFTVGDEVRDFGPGGTWTIGPDVPHGVEVGPEGAIAIEAFAPARVDWRSLPIAGPRAPLWAGERD